ncbi:MAG TPA: histidine phosphatase family protein [Methylomirabilota bacterium]|nr:histidine phosphatase family protein [Methylomirabilota bacterium]
MKSLLILRHAKSSWKHPELTDHDRPLNKRGKRDAPRIGEILRSEHLIPEAIISSTAARAHATAEAVAKASGYKGRIALNRSLYAAGPEAYLKVLHELSDHYKRVLVVGHNPGLEELLEMFTDETQIMPTCTLAHVKFSIDSWIELDYKTKGQLAGIWQSRDLS